MKEITGRGIGRAMRFWTSIEKMTYGPFSIPVLYDDLHLYRTIEEIGINCKNLCFLHLSWFELNWQSADIMVRNLKSVKVLHLYGVCIKKCGLKIFLSRCKKIENVKFSYCFFMNRVNHRSWNFARVPREIKIQRVQEGRRNKWRIDENHVEIGKLHTSKEMMDLLYM